MYHPAAVSEKHNFFCYIRYKCNKRISIVFSCPIAINSLLFPSTSYIYQNENKRIHLFRIKQEKEYLFIFSHFALPFRWFFVVVWEYLLFSMKKLVKWKIHCIKKYVAKFENCIEALEINKTPFLSFKFFCVDFDFF